MVEKEATKPGGGGVSSIQVSNTRSPAGYDQLTDQFRGLGRLPLGLCRDRVRSKQV